MATLPVRGKNLPPIFSLARLCESYGGGTGGRFSFRLWAEVTLCERVKPAAWDRSVAVGWRSVWQLHRSFAHQIKEKWHTLQPSEQHYNIKTQWCGSRSCHQRLTWGGKKMNLYEEKTDYVTWFPAKNSNSSQLPSLETCHSGDYGHLWIRGTFWAPLMTRGARDRGRLD